MSQVMQRSRLAAGPAGAVLFTTVFSVDGATRAGYHAGTQPISALSLGPGGWVQSVNFVVFGLLMGWFALGLQMALSPGLGHVWVPRLTAAAALGLVAAGCFAQDAVTGYPRGDDGQATVAGAIHIAASLIIVVTLVAQCLLLGARFRRRPGDRPWALLSWVTSGVVTVAVLGYIVTLRVGGPAGALERFATVALTLYGAALAWRLRPAPVTRVAPRGRHKSSPHTVTTPVELCSGEQRRPSTPTPEERRVPRRCPRHAGRPRRPTARTRRRRATNRCVDTTSL